MENSAKGRVNGDNYVSNVYKGHLKMLSLSTGFRKNSLLNKDILVKDMKI